MTPFYRAMHEVLERPGYDILTGRAIDYQQVIIEAFGRAILNLLERINLATPHEPTYNPETITFIFVIATALLLLATSIGVTYMILKRRGQKAAQEMSSISTLFDDIARKRFTLSDLLEDARKYAENGRFRDAVRHLYIAVLVALHDKKTIKVDKYKTNDQLARELALASPLLSEPFIAIVDVFHQTWFGKKGLEEEQYQHFAAVAEEILLYGK
ncbi:MAG: DUF4129 domain-containing protein [Defluviitaleaceae bacterium]|nr:DUF4129 domain-containing protein [Defluviitaleaceae bacterium]